MALLSRTTESFLRRTWRRPNETCDPLPQSRILPRCRSSRSTLSPAGNAHIVHRSLHRDDRTSDLRRTPHKKKKTPTQPTQNKHKQTTKPKRKKTPDPRC